MTDNTLEARVAALEAWSSRAALQLGALSYVAERLMAEQLADMEPARVQPVLDELSNPYVFKARVANLVLDDVDTESALSDSAMFAVETLLDSLTVNSLLIRRGRGFS